MNFDLLGYQLEEQTIEFEQKDNGARTTLLFWRLSTSKTLWIDGAKITEALPPPPLPSPILNRMALEASGTKFKQTMEKYKLTRTYT